MVELDGKSSNQILDVLADWNHYLENYVPYYQDPKNQTIEDSQTSTKIQTPASQKPREPRL